MVVYALSLFGFHTLAKSSGPLKPPDLNATDDTVVLVRLEELKTVANRLTVKVLVIPQDSMFDKRLDVLKSDTAVRMDPPNDLGDLQYPAGKSPAQVATTIEAHGDPNSWPFDSYTTDTLSADVLVGTGDARQYIPARVEVSGALDGWDVSVRRVGEASQDSDRLDSVVITLHRAKGPLIFDLGICLVLFSLPALAFAVATQIALGRRKFVPPFVTWFAAMLFAVIPIRNFLPGAPPPGAWVDQALVLWVLIALVAAMVLYMVTWYRQSD
ncbi:DUF4436 domain-containing protein [Mycobacterium parmense]|uniref:DUF4436 domain-containing protein n=1 Tax=Mycobacterium parmense TaxID=185642 RepID=A0A7I7YV99_9MYCO|nr:DUF4436 domain-containing protein [Mycobacterium parmense]